MSSSISTELKTFRDSLSNAFALFAVGSDTFDNSNKLTKVFDQLLDHEINNLERRLSEKDQLQTISAGYLEKPTQLPPTDEDEKEVEVHPPTLVIHAEPSVIVEKYEAPKSAANMILSHPPPPSPIAQEEGDEEIEEVADVEEEEEETEVMKIGKKKYHVGVISKTVYQFIDEETMGETLGTLKDGKIIA
jgi:hypothetical protein